MPTKVVLFGAHGQLGTELARTFGSQRYDLVALPRASADIADAGAIDGILTEHSPAIVINAAAYNMVDAAESDPRAAFEINGLGVRNLAVACRRIGALLVHYSTDYVFDGAAGRPYREEDPTHPLGAYAVSKLTGELLVQAYLDRYLILRTSGVYGPGGVSTARGNFVELMLRLAGSGQPIRVVEDHVASPTFAPALASRTLALIEKGATGIVHTGGGTPLSWYDFARAIFVAAAIEANLTATNEREYRTAARRPRYSALSNAKMESYGIEPMPSIANALSEYMAARKAALSNRDSRRDPLH